MSIYKGVFFCLDNDYKLEMVAVNSEENAHFTFYSLVSQSRSNNVIQIQNLKKNK